MSLMHNNIECSNNFLEEICVMTAWENCILLNTSMVYSLTERRKIMMTSTCCQTLDCITQEQNSKKILVGSWLTKPHKDIEVTLNHLHGLPSWKGNGFNCYYRFSE